MQTQGSMPIYSSTLDAVSKIYKSDGLRGIYQGQAITTLRELHGYGIYFATFELLAQVRTIPFELMCSATGNYTGPRCHLSPQLATALSVASCSGLSDPKRSLTLRLNIYPIDVIKSKLQTDALPSQGNRRYTGAIDAFRQTWRAEGVRGFTKGLLPTMIRAPVANAAVFVAYQAARQQLG